MTNMLCDCKCEVVKFQSHEYPRVVKGTIYQDYKKVKGWYTILQFSLGVILQYIRFTFIFLIGTNYSFYIHFIDSQTILFFLTFFH